MGLWTAKPQPGLKVSIAHEDLAAIEDVHILLYGRLSFLSRDARLTIRYNTVCRRVLEPPLAGLRRRISSCGFAVPEPEGKEPALPFKWNFLLTCHFSTLDENAPRAFAFVPEPRRKGSWGNRGHLVILTPFELVSMHDPWDSHHAYGVDSFFAPRSRIQSVSLQDGAAELSVCDARFTLPMPARLLQALAGWLPPVRAA